METKFNIIYAIRFFNGELTSGNLEIVASRDTTKTEVESNAMCLLRINLKREEGSIFHPDKWFENVQKIDLTVTQIH